MSDDVAKIRTSPFVVMLSIVVISDVIIVMHEFKRAEDIYSLSALKAAAFGLKIVQFFSL